MYPDDVQWLDGRWLALLDGSRHFGYIQFKVAEEGPGFAWERSSLLGRVRRVPAQAVLEENHWSRDDGGRLTLKPDGWDEIDEIDLADPRLSTNGVAVGALSVRWASSEEIDAALENSPGPVDKFD